jgi:tetratricopeptide (TPR) repeat protein
MIIRKQFRWGFVAVIAASLLGCSSVSSAHPPAPEFLQANQAYNQGDYIAAVRGYRALLTRDGYSVPVLYNLGNAWLRLNQPGRAILNYERALWLAPANPAVTQNLHVAQQQSGHAVTQTSLSERALGWFRLDTLAWIGTGAAVTLSVAVLAMRWQRQRPIPGLRPVVVLSAIVLFMSGATLIARWPELDRAVVLAAATPVRVAPADAADVSFLLPSGELVQAGRPYQAYVRVHAEDGRSGWARAQQIGRIIPPAPEH